jgi:V/A-type H+/Na+-transporting ATPase subunit E
MGLEKVIEEILSAGEEQRSKSLAEAAAEREKIISTARSGAEAARKARENEVEHKASTAKHQATSSAELTSRKRFLQEQNAILTQVKQQTLASLAGMDPGQLKPMLDKLCKISAKQLSKGTVHCRKEDEKIVTAPSGFKKVADLKAAGGILAESDDAAFRMDLTFEALLDDVWAKDVQKVYEILFGGA